MISLENWKWGRQEDGREEGVEKSLRCSKGGRTGRERKESGTVRREPLKG